MTLTAEHVITLDGRSLWLPVESLRAHQIDAIRMVVEGLKGYKVVFLDAPTGAGKTIIGDAVRQMYSGKALYVCTTKTLQDQVEREFPRAKVIKGRTNYPTLDEPHLFDLKPPRQTSAANCNKRRSDPEDWPSCDMCEVAPADLNLRIDSFGEAESAYTHCHHCHPHQHCPYIIAKEEAIHSNLAVANTAYFLTEANWVGRFGVQRNADGKITGHAFPLVIVDEADTLPSVLRSQIDLNLSPRDIRRYQFPDKPEYVTKPESWLDWLDTADEIMTEVIQDLAQVPVDERGKALRDLEAATGTLSRIASVRHEIAESPDSWVLDHSEGLSWKSVEVGARARPLVWEHSPSWLLMSATLISPHQMADELGLQDHEWVSVRIDSNFPPERRPINVQPVASVTHKTKERAYPLIARAVATILDNHPGDRILVHTVSYSLTEQLHALLNQAGYGDRVISYTSAAGREPALSNYRRRIDSVLLAPSLDRGVDLPDEDCRVIVIAKVPFPNLGDPVIKKIVYGTRNGKRWYATQTVRALVQMTGRGMRHSNDYCTTYILDNQFLGNVWRNGLSRNLIPRWWVAALNWRSP